MPDKDPDTDRSAGGPGSSHQGGSHGHAKPGEATKPKPGTPTSDAKSHVSGGGGERDSHHTQDAEQKGDRAGH